MIRVSKLADYGMVILSVMSASPNKVMNAASISRASKLPEPTVSKVLKLLVKADILQSKRGINGGYIMLRSANDLSINEIIRAIDGPLCIISCVDTVKSDCKLFDSCTIRRGWGNVNKVLSDVLDNLKLSDMVLDNYISNNTNIGDICCGCH